jgi:Domain of unknown function (DUF4153)
MTALLAAGAALGALGDVLLRPPGPPALGWSLWIAAVAIAALALHRRKARALDRGRAAWLLVGVAFAAALAWRDAPIKLFALASATMAFAIAAYRLDTSWLRRSGIVHYAAVLALGAVRVWTSAAFAILDVARAPRTEPTAAGGWRRAAAIARGLAIAAPLVVVFGALFVSADAVFADLVSSLVRFDFARIASHVVLFAVLAWISTGYLHGFRTGTELPLAEALWQDGATLGVTPGRPRLGLTEIGTALGALDLLFLVFVVVQLRYLSGGDALVQVTPALTYADYARRGFFELVVAVVLVVPVLLAADWLLDRRAGRDAVVFRGLAGVQIALVLAIAASALQRLRLYHATYGLTDARLYAMALLLWAGAVLLWLAATVLSGRRERFAFGALISGLATVAVLFVINPDALIARTNLARAAASGATVPFDVTYALSLHGDAVPVLIEGLPQLPPDAQCRLARRMLQRFPPDQERDIRTWSWGAARASAAVRAHEAELRSVVGPTPECAPR